MVGFLLKKNFFDGWDNFISLMLLNGICIVVLFLFLTAASFFAAFPLLLLITLCTGGMAMSSLLLAISNLTNSIADYASFSWTEFFEHIRYTWKHGCLFALLEIFCWMALCTAVPYYFSFKNFLGLFLGMCTIWMAAVLQLSLFWFFPIRSRLEQNFRKCLKKCFLVFFSNTGFTLFMLFYSIFLILVTPFLAFLVPGPSGILLAWNNALKLRMYQYDWIEQHPELPIRRVRRHIPWQTLLAEDREKVGERTIRTFIFPWKD